jgi:hypothetical protein
MRSTGAGAGQATLPNQRVILSELPGTIAAGCMMKINDEKFGIENCV